MLYFSDLPIRVSEIAPEQVAKINVFKKTAASLGCRYESFGDLTQLDVAVQRHLSETCIDIVKSRPGADDTPKQQRRQNDVPPDYSSLRNWHALLANDVEENIAHLAISASRHLGSYNTFLTSISKETAQLTGALLNAAKKFQRPYKSEILRQEQINNALKSINESAQGFLQFLVNTLPDLDKHFSLAMIDAQRSVNIYNASIGDTTTQVSYLSPTVNSLLKQNAILKNSVSNAATVIEGAALLGSKQISALLKDFCDFLDRANVMLDDLKADLG